MKKILSLCLNLLLLIISDAVPLKLIAGDRSVVKKDGATHTISKYYVVPNDFNPNNVTNSTETTQATLRMNHNLNSKSMNAEYTDTASEHQVSEKRAEATNDQINKNNADVNNTDENSRSGLNDAQVDVATQADDITAESTESVNTEQSLDSDDLGNLQVKPITSSINISSNVTIDEINVNNSSEALQNRSLLIVENATHTFERDVEDELDDLILTKFAIAVQENSVRNLESFWKLIKSNVDRISDDDELLAKIKKLSVLLNIFTNLYEAAQLQKPVESMIDSIIDILRIPFVEKSNMNKSQSQTNVSGDYDEECLRTCGLKRSEPQLDSNGTYLSETESLEASDNLELKNLDLQRRQRGDSDNGDDWVNTSNNSGSNQVTVSNQPTNILRNQLLVPDKLKVDVPDGFNNVRSSIPTLTLNHVVPENDVQEDPKSNQTISDSAEIDENVDDQPLTIKSILADDWPWTIEDKSTKNLPWTIQTRTTDDLPWHIEDKTTEKLPWYIEDKITNYQPWTFKHTTTNTLPWIIGDRRTKKVPWKVENRVDPNWNIENKMGHSPITLYQSRDPSVITHGGKILLHPNQHMTATVHSVKHGVKEPYHIYTYVINPATSLYEIPNSGNIVKVKTRQPNANLETKLYGLSNSHGANEVVYNNNKPSSSYYESQFSLSKPNIDISSQTSNSQLKHTSYVTSPYETSNEVNPSGLSVIPDDDDQPKYLVVRELDTNHKPALLQPITLPSDFQTNSDQENEVPQDPEVGSNPRVLLPDVPSNPFESLINLDNTGPVSTASASASADTSDVNHDIGDTEPNSYNPNINLNLQQTNLHPGVISKASLYSKYTNLPDDYDKPSPVYGGETHKHLGLISTASSNSAYTNLLDEYDEHIYGGQTHQHPSLVSSSASSNSEYTNLPDEYDGPVYGGQTDQHPNLISTSSSSSAYTNLLNEYDEPIYGGKTHQHPGSISSSASSSSGYTNVVDDYDEPIPVYGGQTPKYPGFISKVSADSEYTNIPNDHNNPIPDYGQYTDTHPGLITKVTHYPEYANVVDDYDDQIPVYGGQIHKHPGFISKTSSHSKYTKLPNHYDTGRYPVHIQTPVNGRPTKIEDNLLGSYHTNGHAVHIIQPSLIAHLHGNQPTGLNYLKHLKLKLAPTYRLFTLDNLLKLYNVIIETIEVNGDELDVYDNRALVNIKKIINIILILAEHLEEPEGSIEWYKNIFYNTQKKRHPLEIYVYNLIRQRWLHELMLVLYKNNFNFNILRNPTVFSFLESWQFPNYVENFMEAEGRILGTPEVFDQSFSSQHGLQDKFATHTYDDVLEDVPENLENYVTNNVINSYKTPNASIVLSIAGVKAEPDANAIIHILQNYLHYKSHIEKQENVIIHDNKVEMLKQIILFLRDKGYGASTIADLIRKLYTAVYSIEGKGCQTQHTNFAKNIYDVILPVLRRSGR